MSAKLEIVGMLAEPKHAVSRDGKPILNLSIAHTPRRKNRDTGEFEDAGETLWVRAAWFGDEAELLRMQVEKGMRVRVEGEPRMTVREHNGQTYANLELQWPSIVFLPVARKGQGASERSGWHNPSSTGFGGGTSDSVEAPF